MFKGKGSFVPQMGRPTNEKKDRTIKLRVSDELYERLERESEGNMSGYVREILSSGNSKEEERLRAENKALKDRIEELPKTGDVPKLMSEETYKDLSDMCRLGGFTFERFMERIRELFNDGHIYIEGLTLKTRGDYDLSYLIDVCHRANVDPQEMINKLANNLVRR